MTACVCVCLCERKRCESRKELERQEKAEIGLDATVRIKRPQHLCQRPSETF